MPTYPNPAKQLAIGAILIEDTPNNTIPVLGLRFSGATVQQNGAGFVTISIAGGGGSTSGTGFVHVTGGVQDAAAKLVENADVASAAAIAVSKLAAGANTTVLTTTGGIPVWAAPALPGNLDIPGEAQGDVLYFDGANWTGLPAGTSGQVLKTLGAGADPAWGLASDLDIASQAQGDLLYFDGTNWVRLAAGTSGQVLKTLGAGADPAWGLPSDLDIASQAQGDVLYFNGTNWVRLAAGTSGQFLQTLGAGANPAWATAATLDGSRIFLTNMAAQLGASNAAGNFTTGQVFSVIGAGTIQCTGLKFYWVTTGAPFTIKCSLWNNAGSQLATVNVSVNATGVYTATFATPQTLNPGELYTIGVFNSTNYTRSTQTTINARYPARPASVGGLVVVTDIRAFINGDAKPTNADITEAYIVDPVLTFA